MGLSDESTEGRLDILAFKIVERVARSIEEHNPVLRGFLWKNAAKPIEQLIRQHVPNRQIRIPPEIAKLLAEKINANSGE